MFFQGTVSQFLEDFRNRAISVKDSLSPNRRNSGAVTAVVLVSWDAWDGAESPLIATITTLICLQVRLIEIFFSYPRTKILNKISLDIFHWISRRSRPTSRRWTWTTRETGQRAAKSNERNARTCCRGVVLQNVRRRIFRWGLDDNGSFFTRYNLTCDYAMWNVIFMPVHILGDPVWLVHKIV